MCRRCRHPRRMPGRTMGREESRREARKGKGRRQTQSPSSSQIADFGGCVRRRDARGHGRTAAGRGGRTSLFLSHAPICLSSPLCLRVVPRAGRAGKQRERERVGRRRDRQRAGRRGERRAARASSRSFHGNFYQIFTIIPSGLDSAVRRHGEKERKREGDRAELYDGRAVNCLAPSLPPSVGPSVIAFLHCHGGREAKRGRKICPTLSPHSVPPPLSPLSLHACNTVSAVTSPYLPSFFQAHAHVTLEQLMLMTASGQFFAMSSAVVSTEKGQSLSGRAITRYKLSHA